MNAADPSELVAMMPFAVMLGIEVDAASREEVRGRLPYRDELSTGGGIVIPVTSPAGTGSPTWSMVGR